jgi:hypothetical protein
MCYYFRRNVHRGRWVQDEHQASVPPTLKNALVGALGDVFPVLTYGAWVLAGVQEGCVFFVRYVLSVTHYR